MKIKTIFWLNSSDWFIQLMPRIGVLCSLIGAIGYWSNAMFALNFMIYHSIDCVFWDGMQFPWENLMFELGFMSIFSPALVPFDLTHVHLNAWNSYLIWSYQWLLFRLMLGFGKTKFIDNHETTDNSLYIYHFLFAQPMPNKLAKWVTDHVPQWKWLWQGAAAHMFLVEIPLPFLMLHSYTRIYAFYGTLSLQAGILCTGCFGGFNFLTMILCLSLVVDGSGGGVETMEVLDWSSWWTWSLWLTWCSYIFVSVVCLLFFNSGNTQMWSYWADLTRATVTKSELWWLKHLVRFIRCFNEFHLVHGYGVFPRNRLVHVRLKHVIEGKRESDKEWLTYRWKYLGEYHWTVAPFQPKMDFIMWYNGNGMNLEGFTVPWASSRPTMFSECGMPSRIARRCQEGSADVLRHFGEAPSGTPPAQMRLKIVDQDNQQFLTSWSPEPWTHWMPSIEEYHWDAYLVRLNSDIFLACIEQIETWLLETETTTVAQLGKGNETESVLVTRQVMEYNGRTTSYDTLLITDKDIVEFFDQIHSETATTRKDRFVLTYLTWIIVHRVLKPWPEERSWFELSIVAHEIILMGWEQCLRLIRKPVVVQDDAVNYAMPKTKFLSKDYVDKNTMLWQTHYPYQWKQTKRTFEKLYRFDYYNTGLKLPIKGAGVLSYPHLFISGWEEKQEKRFKKVEEGDKKEK